MRVALVSGSRADEGTALEVQSAFLAAGAYVDLIDINQQPEGDWPSDVAKVTANAMGVASQKLALPGLDLVVLIGDRYEILATAVAASVLGLPIAHLSGGDITEGSQDNNFRHAITKLSHLHFTTNTESTARVIQMGEHPDRVFTVGNPGIDAIMREHIPSFSDVAQFLGLQSANSFILVNWQPETLAHYPNKGLEAILMALGEGSKQTATVFIGQNADYGCHAASDMIASWCSSVAGSAVTVQIKNMERTMYLAALKHCLCLIGNSSSGFYEAPSFGTWTINVGDRQRGRIKAATVLDVIPKPAAIKAVLGDALRLKRPFPHVNPYWSGPSAKQIVNIVYLLARQSTLKNLLYKRFWGIDHAVQPCMGQGTQGSELGQIPQGGDGQVGVQYSLPPGLDS